MIADPPLSLTACNDGNRCNCNMILATGNPAVTRLFHPSFVPERLELWKRKRLGTNAAERPPETTARTYCKRRVRMDRTTSMATFVSVLDAGGFASAGRALGMSPSTVTEHVHALEARLGVPLLNRSTRKISLTEVGGCLL